jgi:2-C-methyl-D-erythritol 4-phosphate cytidylyltransferase/2-C-methyl-D-erythritol 2,4-cyclodiphosphate synthase
MSFGAVIVAGGRGTRLGAGQPKQLLDLGGRAVVEWSLRAFDAHPGLDEGVLVLPADLSTSADRWLGGLTRRWRVVAGGARRQDSVRAGIDALSPSVTVALIHDAARPFVSAAVIDRVAAAALADGAAVPAVPALDTVKRVSAGAMTVRETLPREEVWLAQTPQGFGVAVLKSAWAVVGDDDVTDEGMIVERAGLPVTIVPGERTNMKITTTDDLEAARAAITAGAAPRVGTGYDLHRLVTGRTLMLGGVLVPFEKGPDGHSDGDVLCHAVTDALLGAAGAGDIGRHFPNTDPAWKDAPGLDLLARAVAIVREAGFQPSSVDATIILERPKLAPHIDIIRAHLARVLGVPVGAVGVKGKTNEGVDAVGRGEAIAAHAVAVLVGARS